MNKIFFQENHYLNPVDFSDYKQQEPILARFPTHGGRGRLSDDLVFASIAQY